MTIAPIRATLRGGRTALLTLAALIAGCAGAPETGGGALAVRSVGDQPVVLAGDFRTAVYRHDPDRGTRFIISDLTADQIVRGDFERGQVLHIELLWNPKPGATPIDATATNASIRQIIFVDGEVGIYGGAGFAAPVGELGAPTIRLDVRDASLTLLEHTPGFRDVLGAATARGEITAVHDPGETRRLYFHTSQHVTNTLGRSRFVQASMPVILTRR